MNWIESEPFDEKKLEYVNCDLCNSNDTLHFFVDNSYNLVRCKRCGLVYVNPRPDEAMLLDIYNQLLTDHTYSYFRDYVKHADGLIAEGRAMVGKIEKYKKKGRLLDIGCAAGFFLKAASEYGWETYGVEPLEHFSCFGREKLGLNIFTGQLKDRNFPDEFFDVVTMFDVLCHLRNPTKDLREVSRTLKGDGLLVLQTGNKGELRTKEDGERHGERWETPQHLYHFSKKTLQMLFEKTGFEEIRTTETPTALGKILTALAKPKKEEGQRLFSLLLKRYKRYLRKPYQIFRGLSNNVLGYLYKHKNVSKNLLIFARKIQ